MLVAMLDGWDTQSIGIVAPRLAGELALNDTPTRCDVLECATHWSSVMAQGDPQATIRRAAPRDAPTLASLGAATLY